MRVAAALVCLAVLSACSQDSGNAGTDAPARPANASGSAPAAAAATPPKPTPPQEFAAFWRDFRSALIEGAEPRLASLTRFPLQVRGALDADGVRTVDAEGFRKLLPKLLAQDPGMRETAETLRAYVTRAEQPPERAVSASGETARVASLAFQRTDGVWRLTTVYLDD